MNISNKKNKALKFLGRILFFLVTLFILDFGVGKLLKHFYFQQTSGLLYRTTYTLDSTKADILILGSSTANHHYYPPIFENEMKMSCYNAGRDGNTIFYQYAVLKAVLKRYYPKMIILNIDIKEFEQDEGSYDRLSSLLPYYNYHPEIRSIVKLKGPYEKYKLISKIYPYNSLLFTIGVGNAELNKSRESIVDEKGYVPLYGQVHEQSLVDSFAIDYKLDSEKIKMFNSFVDDCVHSKIKLFIITSPRFLKYQYTDSSLQLAKRIANTYNIPFYSFLNDSTFLKNGNLFHNEGHLNDEGAKTYTKLVIDKINNAQR